MKVLWFSNCSLLAGVARTSGTWLFSMAESLTEHGVKLYNITQSDGSDIIHKENDGLVEYLLPTYRLVNGMPSQKNIKKIVNIVKAVNPDIIHIWGTEFYFGLLAARGYLKGRILLEIQGLRLSCAPVFYGGISPLGLLKCIGLREIIRPSLSLPSKKLSFRKWGKYEIEMLGNIKNISTQSDWIRGWVSNYSSAQTNVFHSFISVRDSFVNEENWVIPNNKRPVILTMSAGSEAYKGLHVAIKALPLIKKRFPRIELRVIGYFGDKNPSYRKPGYTKYILSLIKKNNLSENVKFVGQKTACEIVEEMRTANCFLQTSFVESYSLALAEAMMVGLPCVVSYAGAMPELAMPQVDALFYSPLDSVSCAQKISMVLDSPNLAHALSAHSIERALKRNTKEIALKRQLEIYNAIMK